MAIEFRLGHRDPCWIDTLDERDDPTDARAHSEKAHEIGGAVVGEVHLRKNT